MIILTAHLHVKPENSPAFEAALKDVFRQVEENEPGTVFYRGGKSPDDPETYITIEVYRDEAAYADHRSKDYMREANAKVRPLLEGPPLVKRYEGY